MMTIERLLDNCMISSKIYTDKKIFSLPEGFIKLVTTNLKVSDNVLDNTNDGQPSSSYQKKKKTFNNINTEILNMKSNTEKTFNKL